jgi:hypothetical protein
MGAQKHYKKRFAKQIVSKRFYKKNDKISKTDFFSKQLSHFWAFLGEGSSKTRETISGGKSDPGPFLASDPPTHQGGHRFAFGGL